MLPTRTAPSVPKALWDKLMAAAGPNGAKHCKSNRESAMWLLLLCALLEVSQRCVGAQCL